LRGERQKKESHSKRVEKKKKLNRELTGGGKKQGGKKKSDSLLRKKRGREQKPTRGERFVGNAIHDQVKTRRGKGGGMRGEAKATSSGDEELHGGGGKRCDEETRTYNHWNRKRTHKEGRTYGEKRRRWEIKVKTVIGEARGTSKEPKELARAR